MISFIISCLTGVFYMLNIARMFILIAIFFPKLIFSISYQVVDLGNLGYASSSGVLVNDNKQSVIEVFNGCGKDLVYGHYLFDIKEKPLFILSQTLGSHYHFVKLSNTGWVIGKYTFIEMRNGKKNTSSKPFIFSRENGLEIIDWPFSDDIEFKDINSSNEIVCDVKVDGCSRIYIYKNGHFIDQKIFDGFSMHGFEIENVSSISLNDKGEILGSFQYIIAHPSKVGQFITKTKFFFWDGSVHLIEINESVNSLTASDMNNASQIILNVQNIDGDQEIYLWESRNYIKLLDGTAVRITNFGQIQVKSNRFPEFNVRAGILDTNSMGVQSDLSFLTYGSLKSQIVNLKDYPFQYDGLCSPTSAPPMSNNGSLLVPIEIWGERHTILMSVIDE